jgi:hypothetical protein
LLGERGSERGKNARAACSFLLIQVKADPVAAGVLPGVQQPAGTSLPMMIFARCLKALLVRRNRVAIATTDFPCPTSAISSASSSGVQCRLIRARATVDYCGFLRACDFTSKPD